MRFPPGSTTLEPAARAQLAGVIRRLREDKNLEIQLKQQLSAADVDLASARANPPEPQARALIAGLHRRKLELQGLRSEVAGRARGLLASRADAEASAAVAQLHSIDRELAQTEDALDRLYDLLRPGAARQQDRRTRTASLDFAWGRLDAVKAELLASGVPDVDRRIAKYNAQFNPAADGGTVTVTVVAKKK